MVDGRGGVDGILKVILVDDAEFLSSFNDGDDAAVGAEDDMAICADGRGAVLAGRIQAFAVDQFSVIRIDG